MRAKIQEAAATAFREGTSPGGRREVTIIEEGWGTSGYYSGEVIGRDIPVIFPAGSKMYLNHPTESEEFERPERDLNDLVGTLATTPRTAGIAAVAEANVYGHWQDAISEMANDIGLSIRAYGIAEDGSAGGKDGPIVESLIYGVSIDYVTDPGAGGKVGRLIESARNHDPVKKLAESVTLSSDVTGEQVKDMIKVMERATPEELEAFIGRLAHNLPEPISFKESGSPEPTKQGDKMTPEETARLAALEESVKSLTAENATLKESVATEKTRADRGEEGNLRRDAGVVVRGVLESDNVKDKLPQRAADRIIETSLRGDLPLTSEGKLNKESLKAKAEKALEEEVDYIAETSGLGKVSGAGGGGTGSGLFSESRTEQNSKEDMTALQESFEAGGMTKEAAELAAKGR